MTGEDESQPGAGMRGMFWIVMAIVGGGLLAMILIPLSGR